jgi:DNA-binding Xre family transcriptional regulator
MTSINAMASELIELAGTQAKAAEVSGVSQANLSKLAANEIGIGVRADTVDKIKRALAKLRRSKKRAAS